MRVHGRLGGYQGKRAGNVAADPDVLALIVRRVLQCRDHYLPIPDQRVPRVGLEQTMAEQ